MGDAHQDDVTTHAISVGAALIDVTLGNIGAQAGLTHILVGGPPSSPRKSIQETASG